MKDVYVTITVDWDGDYGFTLESIKKVKKLFHTKTGKYRAIPLTHFITPVYFTRPKNIPVAKKYITEIEDLMKNTNCEIGLHIHCWKSLIDHCKILKYLNTSWSTENSNQGQYDPILNSSGKDTGSVLEYGHSVPLWLYSPSDIEKILKSSKTLLSNKIGLNPSEIKGFRGGGWMTDDEVFKALIKLEFSYDASAVDKDFCNINEINKDITLKTFKDYLDKLWGPKLNSVNPPKNTLFHKAYPKGISNIIDAQPKKIYDGTKNLLEIPDTGLLADYVNDKKMIDHINKALTHAKKIDIAVSIGFHIDTALDYINGIEKVIDHFKKEIRVKFVTCSAAHKHFL